MRQQMNTTESGQNPADGRVGTDDTSLKERLLDMAVKRSSFVNNGRFFFCSELNTLTYWYEDHAHSTRMVYVAAGA
jgi:hypothetical protein